MTASLRAKIAVESHCPRVVTSADVMAVVTRDKVKCLSSDLSLPIQSVIFDPTVLAPNDPIDSIDFRQRHLPYSSEGLWLAWNGSGVGFGPKSSGLCESKPCSGLCQELLFYSHFITAMIGLGILGVKTGNVGEIRKDCGSSDDNSVYSISNKQTVYGFVL